MSLKFSSIPQKRLLQGITSASTSFYVNNILSFDGINNVVPADLGTQHYVAFRNDTGTTLELMEIDPATISAGPITILRRGLSFYGDLTTETTALKLDWGANTIVMFGSDLPQIFQWLKEYIDAAAIAGAVPASTTAAGIVVEGSQAEVDAGTVTKTIASVAYKLFAPLDKLRARLYHDYAADSVGSDAYAITITPAITAYTAGQVFTFKAGTANTGAATLNVSGLGAKAITKNYNVALSTGDIKANQLVMVQYDGVQMQLLSNKMVDLTTDVYGVLPVANAPVPAFYQRVAVNTLTTQKMFSSTSNTDGSILVTYSDTNYLKRYTRDTYTGVYIQTHSITPTTNNDFVSVIILGSYVYLFDDSSNEVRCYRYDLADLTNETLCTMPSIDTAGNNYLITTWTDGTFIYLAQTKASTTGYKLAISGTTFTTSATSTTGIGFDANGKVQTMFDGTNIYVLTVSDGTFTIGKANDSYCATFTNTTKTIACEIDSQISGSLPIYIDTNRMYVGYQIDSYDETAQRKQIMVFIPITKP